VGDSVTSDNLQRKEKTKSCRREGKKKMDEGGKKKKRKKAAVRGRQQRSRCTSKIPFHRKTQREQLCGAVRVTLRSESIHRASERSSSQQCMDIVRLSTQTSKDRKSITRGKTLPKEQLFIA